MPFFLLGKSTKTVWIIDARGLVASSHRRQYVTACTKIILFVTRLRNLQLGVGLKPGHPETLDVVGGGASGGHLGQQLPKDGRHLVGVSVSGCADKNVVVSGVAVDDEVPVGCTGVHATLGDRGRVLHTGQTLPDVGRQLVDDGLPVLFVAVLGPHRA